MSTHTAFRPNEWMVKKCKYFLRFGSNPFADNGWSITSVMTIIYVTTWKLLNNIEYSYISSIFVYKYSQITVNNNKTTEPFHNPFVGKISFNAPKVF